MANCRGWPDYFAPFTFIIFAAIVRGQGVAVGTEQSQIFQAVIVMIAVDMVEPQRLPNDRIIWLNKISPLLAT